jgi:hypothetical protein
MNTTWVKPASWGIVCGAVVAIGIGFIWGGWVTAGTADQMAATRAQAAVVQAFTPVCVAKAETQPKQLAALKAEDSWNRDDFVVKAGWVNNVKEQYRDGVAASCATAALEAMQSKPAATPAKG